MVGAVIQRVYRTRQGRHRYDRLGKSLRYVVDVTTNLIRVLRHRDYSGVHGRRGESV